MQRESFCFLLLLNSALLQVQPILATVFLNRAEEGISACRGTVATITCTTTTGTGFLLWRNSQGKSEKFNNANSVGDNKTLGSTTMTLDSIEPVSNAVVFTSTATVNNMTENTTIQCDGGPVPQSINVTVKSPSSPLWAHSACSFSQDSVQLSWNAPSVAAECCAQYTVQLSNGSVYNTFKTSITVPIGKESVTGAVHCVDHVGEMVTKTEDITINTNIAIEQVTIEPVNSSCDANTTYQISWLLYQDLQGICTSPITMSTITCTTSSTKQSSHTQSMNCSVPANETVNVAVTITNAAGVTALESASAEALAQTCRRLNSALVNSTPSPSVEAVTGQLSPAGIAIVILGLLLFICIILVVVLIIIVALLLCADNRQN